MLQSNEGFRSTDGDEKRRRVTESTKAERESGVDNLVGFERIFSLDHSLMIDTSS